MNDLYARITNQLATVNDLLKPFEAAPRGQDSQRKIGVKLDAAVSDLLKLNRGISRYHKLLKPYFALYHYQYICGSDQGMQHYLREYLAVMETNSGPSTRELADMYHYYIGLRLTGQKIPAKDLKRTSQLIQNYLLFEDEDADCPEGCALDDGSMLTSRMWARNQMSQWG